MGRKHKLGNALRNWPKCLAGAVIPTLAALRLYSQFAETRYNPLDSNGGQYRSAFRHSCDV